VRSTPGGRVTPLPCSRCVIVLGSGSFAEHRRFLAFAIAFRAFLRARSSTFAACYRGAVGGAEGAQVRVVVVVAWSDVVYVGAGAGAALSVFDPRALSAVAGEDAGADGRPVRGQPAAAGAGAPRGHGEHPLVRVWGRWPAWVCAGGCS